MRIELYDTTLRDGSQGEGINFSLQDKLLLTSKLDEFGVDYIEGGYPLSNPKDAAYFQEAAKLPLKHAKVTAFGMTRRKGVSAADDVGIRLIPIVVAHGPPLPVVEHFDSTFVGRASTNQPQIPFVLRHRC